MSVLAELEALQQKRVQYVEAIKKIDDELERVRVALGLTARQMPRSLTSAERYVSPYVSAESPTSHKIFDALTEREPLTVREIADRTHVSVDAVSQACVSLRKQGRLYGVRRSSGIGRPMVFARSAEALGHLTPSDTSGETDDELGKRATLLASAGTTSAATGTAPTAPASLDDSAISETLSTTHG